MRAREALRAAQHRRGAQFLFRAAHRVRLRRAVAHWRAMRRRAAEAERARASVAVQRVWRGYTGRCRAHLVRRAQSQQALDTIAALASLRAGARVRAMHRWRERRKASAARAVQRSWRLALARRRMRRLRASARRRAEHYARRQLASRVAQRVGRGFLGRRAARRFRAVRAAASSPTRVLRRPPTLITPPCRDARARRCASSAPCAATGPGRSARGLSGSCASCVRLCAFRCVTKRAGDALSSCTCSDLTFPSFSLALSLSLPCCTSATGGPRRAAGSWLDAHPFACNASTRRPQCRFSAWRAGSSGAAQPCSGVTPCMSTSRTLGTVLPRVRGSPPGEPD